MENSIGDQRTLLGGMEGRRPGSRAALWLAAALGLGGDRAYRSYRTYRARSGALTVS